MNRIGFTASAFDLLHAGHVAMLLESKQNCDYLICGLHIDPSMERPEKNKPVQSVVERFLQLQGCRYVDEIIPYQTEADLMDILRMVTIDVRFVGQEYKNKAFTGKEYCLQNNIEIFYNRRHHGFSSSELRNRIAPPPETFSIVGDDTPSTGPVFMTECGQETWVTPDFEVKFNYGS